MITAGTALIYFIFYAIFIKSFRGTHLSHILSRQGAGVGDGETGKELQVLQRRQIDQLKRSVCPTQTEPLQLTQFGHRLKVKLVFRGDGRGAESLQLNAVRRQDAGSSPRTSAHLEGAQSRHLLECQCSLLPPFVALRQLHFAHIYHLRALP